MVRRRNWLFSGSPIDASASATLYSLIEKAKLGVTEPYRYLRYIFAKLPLAQKHGDYLRFMSYGLGLQGWDLSSGYISFAHAMRECCDGGDYPRPENRYLCATNRSS